MLNNVVLIGRLTADPELRYTKSGGVAVTNFRIAVDRPYVTGDGNRDTDFLNIVAWRKLAEVVAENLNKGRLVAVRGSIEVREWQTDDGSRRRDYEIKADDVRFLDSPKGNSGNRKSDFEDFIDEFEGEVEGNDMLPF